MRVIHNASLIILVIDILKKIPINEAIILCNGVQLPYLKKDNGYFIFCDLQGGDYKIEVFSPGFVKREVDCTITLGECKRLIFEMPFKSNNHRISRLPRIEFLLKNKNRILSNKNARVIMKTPVSSLKLVNNAKKGSMEVVLNVENLPGFIFQNYIYEFVDPSKKEEKDNEEKNKDELDISNVDVDNLIDKLDNGEEIDDVESPEKKEEEKDDEKLEDKDESEDNEKSNGDKEEEKKLKTEELSKDKNKEFEELFFLGYDIEYSSYIILNPLQKDLKVGGNFFPFWNLSSDDQGKITIPIFPRFMDKDFFYIEVKVDDLSEVIKIDTNNINENNIIFYVINLK